jgi:hypothetical protein
MEFEDFVFDGVWQNFAKGRKLKPYHQLREEKKIEYIKF